jgi:hypothetical protein
MLCETFTTCTKVNRSEITFLDYMGGGEGGRRASTDRDAVSCLYEISLDIGNYEEHHLQVSDTTKSGRTLPEFWQMSTSVQSITPQKRVFINVRKDKYMVRHCRVLKNIKRNKICMGFLPP